MMPGQAINNAAPTPADADDPAPRAGTAPWRRIDARGLACPLPALRLAAAVRRLGPGHYELLADDPAAGRDIPALAAERGWTMAAGAPAGRFRVVVEG